MIRFMTNRLGPHRLLGLTAVALIAAVAGACSAAVATPTLAPLITPAPTVTAATAATATDTAPPYLPPPAVAPTDTTAPISVPTAAPTTGPVTRSAWATGQTVMQDILVGPGIGWVRTNRGIWQTIDDGVSWANAYPHSLIASSIRGLGAFDANHALLAAVDVGPTTSTYYIWRTVNGGQSWVYVALPPVPHDIPDPCCAHGAGDPPATFDYMDASTAFVVVTMHTGTDGRVNYVYETTDGGATWVSRSYDATLLSGGPPPPTRVEFMTRSIGVAQQGNEVSSTTSGWGSWSDQLLPNAVYDTPSITFVSATNWFADEGGDYQSNHYRYGVTTDQGHTWTEHMVDIPGLANLTGAHVQFLSPLVWIGTEETTTGGVSPTFGTPKTIYTVDGGVHWALMGDQPFAGSIAHFVDATHGWAGPNDQLSTARLYSTGNGGLSWRLLTP